ncbi:MAG: hypothetical protein EBU08_09240, partial [Micrococcales bacterium]|nr:hypothetical protein [Micrococcales bacterium]
KNYNDFVPSNPDKLVELKIAGRYRMIPVWATKLDFEVRPGLKFDERALIAGASSKDSKSENLEEWIRNEFFDQHCELFHERPFIWHIWDGRKDGFGALVNYHKLDQSNLNKLTYTYLGDWIRQQQAEAKAGKPGAAERLGAAKELQGELEKILEARSKWEKRNAKETERVGASREKERPPKLKRSESRDVSPSVSLDDEEVLERLRESSPFRKAPTPRGSRPPSAYRDQRTPSALRAIREESEPYKSPTLEEAVVEKKSSREATPEPLYNLDALELAAFAPKPTVSKPAFRRPVLSAETVRRSREDVSQPSPKGRVAKQPAYTKAPNKFEPSKKVSKTAEIDVPLRASFPLKEPAAPVSVKDLESLEKLPFVELLRRAPKKPTGPPPKPKTRDPSPRAESPAGKTAYKQPPPSSFLNQDERAGFKATLLKNHEIDEDFADRLTTIAVKALEKPESERNAYFKGVLGKNNKSVDVNQLKAIEQTKLLVESLASTKPKAREGETALGLGLFDNIKWGTFKQLKERLGFNGSLHELAKEIIDHPDKYSKKAFKKAQFYHNVIGGDLHIDINSHNNNSSDEEVGEGLPCWKGYVQRGMKMKNGKKVPNCIPRKFGGDGMMLGEDDISEDGNDTGSDDGEEIVETKSHHRIMTHPAMMSSPHFRHPNAQSNINALSGGLLRDDLQEGYNKVVPKSLRPQVSDLAKDSVRYVGRQMKPKAQKAYNKVVPKSLRPAVSELGKDAGNYVKRRLGFGLGAGMEGCGVKKYAKDALKTYVPASMRGSVKQLAKEGAKEFYQTSGAKEAVHEAKEHYGRAKEQYEEMVPKSIRKSVAELGKATLKEGKKMSGMGDPLHPTEIPHGTGMKMKKGSQEMKEKMAKLRAMRKKKMSGGMLDAEPPRSRSYTTNPSITGGELPPRSRMP